MCLIIHNPKAKDVSWETISNAMSMNPDGFGIFFHDTKEIVRSMKWGEIEALLDTGRPYTAHFRYATSGPIKEANCHPFEIDDTFSIMMNGTIDRLVSTKTVDTVALCRILNGLSRDKMLEILATYPCRFALLNRSTGKVDIVNRDLWTIRDGVHYSKATCFPAEGKQATNRTPLTCYSQEEDEVDREWEEWESMLKEEQDSWLDTPPTRNPKPESGILHSVAVYGTLKEGHGNHGLLRDSYYIGEGFTSEPYPLIVDGLPYLIDRKGKGKCVHVEVYRVDDATLAQLDRLEGHPDWYQRKQIQVQLYAGGTVTVWIYMIPDSKSKTHIKDTGVYVDCF
jgi:gamma-glutamylaminecyclotransferase